MNDKERMCMKELDTLTRTASGSHLQATKQDIWETNLEMGNIVLEKSELWSKPRVPACRRVSIEFSSDLSTYVPNIKDASARGVPPPAEVISLSPETVTAVKELRSIVTPFAILAGPCQNMCPPPRIANGQ